MAASQKGFLRRNLFSNIKLAPQTSVKQILAPPFIAVPDQPHQLPGSVQRKRPRSARQLQAGFFRCPVALAVIAPVAAGHQVLPGRSPASRARHHVVQRQFRARKYAHAKLTSIAVPQQYVLPRKRAALLRNMPVREQADHGRHFVGMRRGMYFRVVQLFRLRHTLQHQYHRASLCRHVNRLVRRVQHKHRLLHERRTPRRNQVVGSTASGTLGTGHSLARHFRGIASPGDDRHVPVCAHRVFLELSYHSLVPGRGDLTARAIVSPNTDLAPASRSALAHASSVAPVVNTSSTSKTRRLSTWVPGRVAKAPRTEAHRSSKLSTRLSGRARVRISSTALCGNCSRFASGLERSAAWLYPRSRSRWRCSGTGTTTSAVSAAPSVFTNSVSRSANQAPRGSICSNFSNRIARTTAP